MDAFYDDKAAKELIEAWAVNMSGPNAPPAIHDFAVPACTVKVEHLSVKKLSGGYVSKVMIRGSNGRREEVVFTVVGALIKVDLPPVKKNQYTPSSIKNARQNATLAGFNTTKFNQALTAIQDVTYAVATSFPDGEMTPWTVDSSSDVFGDTLSANSRYFTFGHNIPENLKVPFNRYVDPADVLSKFLNEQVAHCVDNDVIYMELKNGKFVTKDPAGFRAGDIVEIGFAVTTFKSSKRDEDIRHVTKLELRTLTLLDTTLSKSAYANRHNKASGSNKIKSRRVHGGDQAAKRRRMYEEDSSDDETSQKFFSLTLGTKAKTDAGDSVMTSVHV
ncbi:hypothetical protein DFH07DRAFT_769807 [Mycena maculata]|uniref:Uncharacterized protein n=1 Tax=Mycena maculata TaxID=230809 RepID=A0AAD7JP58_9AGAR|nr:hypothetical protein DFH07DRAFT_769807 [Mycena maculata]